jgi:hypothetical protein
LGWLGKPGVKERLAGLAGDEAQVEFFDQDELRAASVAELAQEALQRL